MVAGGWTKKRIEKQTHLHANISNPVYRRWIVRFVTMWVLLLAGNIAAWGATGSVTINSPAIPPRGILEVDENFIVNVSYELTSDSSWWDDGNFGNHTYTWAHASFPSIDAGTLPNPGPTPWFTTTGPIFTPPLGKAGFSFPVNIANLEVNRVHKITMNFYDDWNTSGKHAVSLIDSKSLIFKVVKPKECKLAVSIGSSADVASGNLSHSQELFTTKGNTMPTSISLYYNSLDAHPVNLGPGWNHSYDIELATMISGSVTLREADGTRHIYKKSGTIYTSQPGDTSTLVQKVDGSYCVTFLGGLTYNFVTMGLISSIIDRFGNKLSFTYANGNLSNVTDSSGRTTQFNYDANLLSTITDPAGNIYTFGYTADNLTSITNPAVMIASGALQVSRWAYTYSSTGLLESKTDPNNNKTTYIYDANNRVYQATDPTLNTRTVNYAPIQNSVSKTSTFVEKDQGVWTYVYDGTQGLLTGRTDPNGKTTSYYYNTDRTVRAKKEPLDGNTVLTTFYTYDSHGNVLTQTDPTVISTYTPAIDPQTVVISTLATLNPSIKTAIAYTYDYANYDQVASITDYRGSVATTTTYQYTIENGYQVTRVTDPDNHVSTTRYYANGTIKDTTDANQQVTTYTYYTDTPDNRVAGTVELLQTVTGPDGVITSYTSYDMSGNSLEIKTIGTDNKEIRTVQVFDAKNRLITVTRHAQGLPNNITTYGYDDDGNRVSQIDPEGKETKYVYDYQGRVIKVTDAQQHETLYSYGGSGGTSCTSCSGGGDDKLTAVTDAKSQTTSYQYDTLGRLILETDPLGKKIKYTWYDNGKLKEKIDATVMPEKVLITYTYDTLGQLIKKRYADGSEETYSYDLKGRLQTATNVNIGYSFTYFGNGWLKSVADSAGRTINYDQYDGMGQKKLVTYFPGTTGQRQISFGYDPADLNRIKAITSAAGTFTYGYDSFGRRNSLSYPNGTGAAYLYDDLNRLTSLTHSSGGSAFLTYGYTHDQAGNRKTKTGTIPETYDYDEVYRLKQASTAAGSQKYTYDAVGNRLNGPGPKDAAYQYDAANRMLIGKQFGYTYDNSGNQISRTIPNAPDKTWTLTWDYENRLTKMELSKGTSEKETVSFKYDPMGRRIEKKLATTIGDTMKTTTFIYVYDGDNIALEIMSDATGSTTKTFYTHGSGTDEHLALERNGNFYFYHADGLGSVTAVTDQSKKVVQSYTYDAFGMVKPQTDFRNSYTYTGREWDKETGLYYYRARYYDPMEGRFISKDPIGFRGGINLYNYVQNNPINFIDPKGLNTVAIWHAACTKQPTAKTRCECHCVYASDYDGCMKTCMDCFSSKKPLSPKELCKCICKQAGLDNCDCICSGVK